MIGEAVYTDLKNSVICRYFYDHRHIITASIDHSLDSTQVNEDYRQNNCLII